MLNHVPHTIPSVVESIGFLHERFKIGEDFAAVVRKANRDRMNAPRLPHLSNGAIVRYNLALRAFRVFRVRRL